MTRPDPGALMRHLKSDVQRRNEADTILRAAAEYTYRRCPDDSGVTSMSIDGYFYGADRISAYVDLVAELWRSGLPDSITKVIMEAWNGVHCRPPVDPEELSHIPLIRDTILFVDWVY